MKKAVSLILSFILLSSFAMSLSSCNEYIEKYACDTIVGEIIFTKTDSLYEHTDLNHHYLYVKLCGAKNDVLFLFDLTSDATAESRFSANIDEMPELAIGNVVEINYYKRIDANRNGVLGYKIKSIRTTAPDPDRRYDIDLTVRSDYDFGSITQGIGIDCGTVLHVARIEAPISGYLVYLDGVEVLPDKLNLYWLPDDECHIPMEILKKLDQKETGYKIHIHRAIGSHPFSNSDAEDAISVEACDHN